MAVDEEILRDEDDCEAADQVDALEAAGLYYVMDGEPGFTREKDGKEFRYLDLKGRPITSARHLERIRKLAIPPAWTGVWICSRPNGHIQATGRDAKGRKQYRYHPGWNEIRSQSKFIRIVQFGEALPGIREKVNADLRRPRFDRLKVTALVVRLLETTLIRVGNDEYARQNNSYGLTTLTDDHIAVEGSTLRMNFIGKKGKQYEIGLRDRRLAALVKRCQDLPGQRLFQYIDEDGACCQSITSGDVNGYLRESAGQEYSAKDFRTWAGSVRAASELYHIGPAETEKQAEKNIVQVVKLASGALGNTPTVCRKYYIHPSVLEAYRRGTLFGAMETALARGAHAGLSAEEHAVLNILTVGKEGDHGNTGAA